MRPNNNNNRRGRGRGQRKPHGGPHGGGGGGGHGGHGGVPKGQTYDSTGPDIRVRGNAYQVLEKYLQLARDAGTVGDRVAAENFLQHADHYYRVVASLNEGQRPRIGGREVSVADVNVQNVSQGLSAALSGHGHSGGGSDDSADAGPQPGNGAPRHQGHQGQQQAHGHDEGQHRAVQNASENGEMPSANGADTEAAHAPRTGNMDEQPDYPEELLPQGAQPGGQQPASEAQPDGQEDGRGEARAPQARGRGRRRGPARKTRGEGDEAPTPTPGAPDNA
ncbi:MAG TPA: DUF4167 domain-containing protein [Dongiaceae bacterium]